MKQNSLNFESLLLHKAKCSTLKIESKKIIIQDHNLRKDLYKQTDSTISISIYLYSNTSGKNVAQKLEFQENLNKNEQSPATRQIEYSQFIIIIYTVYLHRTKQYKSFLILSIMTDVKKQDFSMMFQQFIVLRIHFSNTFICTCSKGY